MESATSIGILEDLIETLEDGAKGFERAAELLQEGERAPSLASEMLAFSEQRRRFSAELHEIAARHGEPIDAGGSAGGAIHRIWMELTDTATGTDVTAMLAATKNGEDHAIAEYEDALERDDLPDDVRRAVARQAQAIRAVHDVVEGMLDDFAG